MSGWQVICLDHQLTLANASLIPNVKLRQAASTEQVLNNRLRERFRAVVRQPMVPMRTEIRLVDLSPMNNGKSTSIEGIAFDMSSSCGLICRKAEHC